MQLEVLLLIAALICVAIVAYFVAPAVFRNHGKEVKQFDKINHKHGLPILPRNERKSTDAELAAVEEDALSSMAAAVVAAPEQAPIESIESNSTVLNTTSVHEEQKQVKEVAHTTAMHTASEIDTISDEPFVRTQLLSEDFDKESSVLDQHLEQRQLLDEDESLLNGCEDAFSVIVTPKYGSSISGRQVLDIARDYGLKYGAMNMFHRFENEDGRGVRWFSMMAEGREGPTAFDLNTITESNFTSLILFLVIPHQQPLRGYDSMVSTANMLSQKLNAVLTDENRNPLDDDYFARCRAFFIDQ